MWRQYLLWKATEQKTGGGALISTYIWGLHSMVSSLHSLGIPTDWQVVFLTSKKHNYFIEITTISSITKRLRCRIRLFASFSEVSPVSNLSFCKKANKREKERRLHLLFFFLNGSNTSTQLFGEKNNENAIFSSLTDPPRFDTGEDKLDRHPNPKRNSACVFAFSP